MGKSNNRYRTTFIYIRNDIQFKGSMGHLKITKSQYKPQKRDLR